MIIIFIYMFFTTKMLILTHPKRYHSHVVQFIFTIHNPFFFQGTAKGQTSFCPAPGRRTHFDDEHSPLQGSFTRPGGRNSVISSSSMSSHNLWGTPSTSSARLIRSFLFNQKFQVLFQILFVRLIYVSFGPLFRVSDVYIFPGGLSRYSIFIQKKYFNFFISI